MPHSDVRYVSVNSADRDVRAWPLPSVYDVDLEDVWNVTDVQVRNARMPTVYPVAQGRDTLTVTAGGVRATVRAVAPAYTRGDADAYLAALQAELRTTLPAGGWIVGFGPGGRVRFEASIPFVLEGYEGATAPLDGYGARGAGRALGLPAAARATASPSAVAAGRFELTAPFRNQLDEPETLYLHVEGMGAVETPVNSAGLGADGCMFVVDAQAAITQQQQDGGPTRHFHPPMARMRRLHVRVVDFYGCAAAFDNREHRFDLVVHTTDAAANSRRGYNPT